MRIVRKTLKIILISILSILLIGVIYEQLAQIYFNYKKPPASEFVEIDGVATHFVKKGNGGPTVVFQSGLGGDYKIWEKLQDSLSKITTTISYDRSGLLWSDSSKDPKTLESITRELEVLLEKTNCPKPYILVGHSLAGITLLPYIKAHDEAVAGVVFLDAADPLQVKRVSEELKKHLAVPPTWIVSVLIETGIARAYFTFNPFIADIPGSHPLNKHITNYFYKIYRTFLQEAREDDLMFEEAEKITSLGDIPLVVVTGTYPDGAFFLSSPILEKEYLGIHRRGQQDLLSLSTHSKQLMATHSGHYVQLTDFPLVFKAIKDLIALQ